MSLVAVVATVMLAILFAFVGMVVWATMRQVGEETRRAAIGRKR